ncbi:MAG: putative metal-dependent hydrolase [Phycisphaera sp.]|nr:MAG: putative metal-dependent hydrolase [Phycisphaera sp.]
MESPPNFPAGSMPSPLPEAFTLGDLAPFIARIESAPRLLREAVGGLTGAQLDTAYRNWTVRQIVHHLADSHANCYIRFMWALTESSPTIKAYDEGAWSALQVSRTGDIEPALVLLEALHAKWVMLLCSMSVDDFARTFTHPETGDLVRLADLPALYAWHAEHHTAAINWLCHDRGW